MPKASKATASEHESVDRVDQDHGPVTAELDQQLAQGGHRLENLFTHLVARTAGRNEPGRHLTDVAGERAPGGRGISGLIQRRVRLRATFAGLGLITLVLAAATAATAAPPDREDALQIHNRDVYFLDGVNLRNPTTETPDEAQLYSVVGAAMPLTWGEWQAASAQSRVATRSGGGESETDARIRLSGLIPGGVYSVFYGTFGPDSDHPLCSGVERTLPLTTSQPERQRPDPSSFVADAAGEARYHGRVEGALLEADQLFFSLVYHFDGMTYDPFPNRGEFFTQGPDCRSTYGEDAMRHLLILQNWL